MGATPKIFETGAMKMEPGQSASDFSDTFTADAGTDILTVGSNHGLVTGNIVQFTTSTADLPDPLAIDTEYFVILVDADEIQVATTLANAVAETEINITDAGTGTHTLHHWTVPHDGWGGATGVQTLGANDAFPWLNFSSKLNIATAEDESVVTKAFKTTPRLIGKTVDNPVSFHARYKGMNRFHYWMWGFENEVKEVVVCRAGSSPFSAAPTIGDTCTDVATNGFTFLRTEILRDETRLYIFEADDSLAPAGGLTLTETGGSPWVFTFVTTSAVMYEHVYELDSRGRRLRSYTIAEVAAITDILATDKRNIMCTLAKRTDNYDLRYANSMCKNFSLKMTAAGLSSWDANYMAYVEERSILANGYASDDWTLVSGLEDGQLIPAHFEYRFYMGETITPGTEGEVTGLTETAMTDISFDVEVPLQSLQDTVSGLGLAEPILEGKYGIRCVGTISRHTAQTWQTYRDAQTKIVAHMIANQGDYMQEIMMKECTLSESGGDDSEVMQEPLALELGYLIGTSEWSDYLEGVTELHDSPAILRIRDDSDVNQMALL